MTEIMIKHEIWGIKYKGKQMTSKHGLITVIKKGNQEKKRCLSRSRKKINELQRYSEKERN